MAAAGTPLDQRHEATRHAMDGAAADVAASVYRLAQHLLDILGDGIELTAGLRKLREGKDCCVIQGLEDSGQIGGRQP